MEFKADRDKLESEDLVDMAKIIRIHVEIRNRSFMRRVHRDCSLGSDAVDFMVSYSKSEFKSFGMHTIMKRKCYILQCKCSNREILTAHFSLSAIC